jgi:hypothetical protein
MRAEISTLRIGLRGTVLLAVVVAVAAGLSWAPVAAAAPSAVLATGDAAQLLDLVNGDRADNGLAPLHWRDDVAAIALSWSTQMAATGVLAHNDAYFSPATGAALGSGARGENVAFTGSVDAANYAFMNSPGHRANILDPRFTDVGIAVVPDRNGGIWVTEDFIQTAGPPTFAPSPDPQPEVAPPAMPEPAAAEPPPPEPPAAEPPTAATEPVVTPPPPEPVADPLGAQTEPAGLPAQSGQQAAGGLGFGTSLNGVPVRVADGAAALLAIDIAGILFALRRRPTARVTPIP